MKLLVLVSFLFLLLCLSHCRDYYIGMFKRNDILVAQDRLYKEKIPFRKVIAKYGRLFTCPITYFRVVDRLGLGTGPNVKVIRGGLLKKYIVVRLISPYNLPISVNVYVGCENKIVRTTPTTTVTTSIGKDGSNATATEAAGDTGGGDVTEQAGDNSTAPTTASEVEETEAKED